jgi:hypothetical protein
MKSNASLTALKIIGLILLVLFLIVAEKTALLFQTVIILNGIQYRKFFSPLTESHWIIETDPKKRIAQRMKKSDMLAEDLIGLIHDEELDRMERKLIKNPHMQVSRIF